jgi:DNA processing protein
MDGQDTLSPPVCSDTVLLSWWRLRRVKGLGNITLNEVRHALASPHDLPDCTRNDLIGLGLPPDAVDAWLHDPSLSSGFDQLTQWCSVSGQGVLLAGTGAYPESLSALRDAPIFLWYRGNLNALRQQGIAMVGSRGATPGAIEWTQNTAAALAGSGITVVSGLALGIDGAAHLGAVQEGGATIAVMGTGPDIIYPARHRALADNIIHNGLLLSEFPPGTRAQARHFPSRNRIISGLSCATVVVEAGIKSGTMITARLAADQGRDVLAVPGALANPLSAGPHQLIREGAMLVENADQILDTIMPLGQPSLPGMRPSYQGADYSNLSFDNLTSDNLSPSAAALKTQSSNTQSPDIQSPVSSAPEELPDLLNHIDFNPTPIDVIALRSTRTIPELMGELLQLELDGWLQQAPGGYCRQR